MTEVVDYNRESAGPPRCELHDALIGELGVEGDEVPRSIVDVQVEIGVAVTDQDDRARLSRPGKSEVVEFLTPDGVVHLVCAMLFVELGIFLPLLAVLLRPFVP